MPGKTVVPTGVVIPPLNLQNLQITVIGDSPLVSNRFSEKARQQMLDKQRGKAAQKKGPKIPEDDFKGSLYEHPEGGYGFKAAAFKLAAVSAVRNVSGLTMTLARGAFHTIGTWAPTYGEQLILIEGSEPRMREDMVRVANGAADIRFRGEFWPWMATVNVRFNADVLSVEQITNLFNVAGFAVGIGEQRPERGGSWGMFHVADQAEMGALHDGTSLEEIILAYEVAALEEEAAAA